jgi:peptidoglycan/xylan/chitin deacetylase (PgdA/CDA1 family)
MRQVAIGKHIKSYARESVANLYLASQIHRITHRGRVLILNYHRVLPKAELRKRYVQPAMYVLDNVFDMHLRFLQEHFKVLTLAELLERWRKRVWDSRQRYCVLTFDDGWLDNYIYAYPLLKKYGLPATIFLPTDFIGTYDWFWTEKLFYLIELVCGANLASARKAAFWSQIERALGGSGYASSTLNAFYGNKEHNFDQIVEECKNLPVENVHKLIRNLSELLEIKFPEERAIVNWDEVALMSKDGISFGSHSCSHRILTRLHRYEIKRELEVSKRALQEGQMNINYVPVFCYPNGMYNQDIQGLVKDCAYEAAVGLRPGSEGELPKNWFEIRRIGIHNEISATLPLFAFHLLRPRL